MKKGGRAKGAERRLDNLEEAGRTGGKEVIHVTLPSSSPPEQPMLNYDLPSKPESTSQEILIFEAGDHTKRNGCLATILKVIGGRN